jgi:hypothetical protein
MVADTLATKLGFHLQRMYVIAISMYNGIQPAGMV